MKPITVLLADDHTIVREGLRTLLRLEPEIQIIGEAENGRQAVEMVAQLLPDVVLMDIAMPLLNGMEATRQILQANSSAKILMLSAHNDDTHIEAVMSLGACGYLIKQTAVHTLQEAIRKVHQGGTYFCPMVTQRIEQQRKGEDGAAKKTTPLLTSRETEVLQLIAEGKPNKEAAAVLNISIKTVEKHRQSLMGKLNIHDTASLTRYAISAGVIESSVQCTIVEDPI